MYPDARIGDIQRIDNAKAERQAKSDKAPMDRCSWPLQSCRYRCAGPIRL
jgi:hypothetical protein